ncbi:Rpn family recombination-promoting nuclease/putative transposase [Arcicella sp. LKC2W]|uniref:Rpn family recombination-promoting nuclease/putative transposase n=1 Tax=Arcicella sp. LKC2W TaxID=2984198 RepID=UPI002B201509|nr:Rpn family recombination-promoting nuclease/putative transposase [Arcicella sp. LKC2W]MEA5458033.1 Rpn family recombination-promoting nuclease/putative transposase [Arcicella sp. LKC2W]
MELYNDNERFISILSDYGFKATFGNESDTTFLKKALQALIKSPVAIREIEFIKNEMTAITLDSRSGIYDLACTDENDNHFIVEMQLSEYPEFIQRMKFYALYRFNTLVKKGKYTFEGLQKIYCIGILANDIFSHIFDYHNVAVLRNEKGELIDDQMTFVTVELAKFDTPLAEIKTDLDKLIFTMKNLHTITEQTQFPMFWNEEWLNVAIQELDKKAMTPEQRLNYEMIISANALAVKNEKKKIEEAELRIKYETVKKMLASKQFSIEDIANFSGTSVDFVNTVQLEINSPK